MLKIFQTQLENMYRLVFFFISFILLIDIYIQIIYVRKRATGKDWGGKEHCKTHGAWNSNSGLGIYVRYFVPLWLENHSQVIHLREVYCTLMVGNSYVRDSYCSSSTCMRYIVPLKYEKVKNSSIKCPFCIKDSYPINR